MSHENVFLSFTKTDNEILEYACKRTGYTRTALLRRLLLLYASGTHIVGMPAISKTSMADKALSGK